MCFNVGNLCTGTDVEHVTVTQPGPKPRNAVDALNRTAVEEALVELGGRLQGVCTAPRKKLNRFCQQNSECDSAPGTGDGLCSRVVKFSPLAKADTCTPFADITVPLRRGGGRLLLGRRFLRLRTFQYERGTPHDLDRLTLVCRPK